jgi:hypothetical protein
MVVVVDLLSDRARRLAGIDEPEIEFVVLYRRGKAGPVPIFGFGILEMIRPHLFPIGYFIIFDRLGYLVENLDRIGQVLARHY